MLTILIDSNEKKRKTKKKSPTTKWSVLGNNAIKLIKQILIEHNI